MRKKIIKEKVTEIISKPSYVPHDITALESDSISILDTVSQTEEELQTLYSLIADDDTSNDPDTEIQQKIISLSTASDNLREAHHRTKNMVDELSSRWGDYKKSQKPRKIIARAPTNASIDLREEESGHFSHGINIYKLLWICYIGSFVGVIIELIWCVLRNGYLESRAGLVYGPFNLLYGIGAVALSVSLYKYRNFAKTRSFLGGFIVGSLVEYVCSWAQEAAFGSRSWDYSEMPLNLNGRICLLYSVFWGFLGVFWIKSIYPRMSDLILKIPNRIGKIITWLILAFFIFDAIVSLIACFRWSQRVDGIEAANFFWRFIDSRFPNERMQRIFANMEF